jgi:hypothetical protein
MKRIDGKVAGGLQQPGFNIDESSFDDTLSNVLDVPQES